MSAYRYHLSMKDIGHPMWSSVETFPLRTVKSVSLGALHWTTWTMAVWGVPIVVTEVSNERYFGSYVFD